MLNLLKKVKREYEGIYRFYNDKKLDSFVAKLHEVEKFHKNYEIDKFKELSATIDGIEIDIKSAYSGNLFQLIYDKNVIETSGNSIRRLEKKY